MLRRGAVQCNINDCSLLAGHGGPHHHKSNKKCLTIQTQPFACCDLEWGHSGAHMDYDPETSLPRRVWFSQLQKCNDVGPQGNHYKCDLQQGHGGPHILYDYSGVEIARWAPVYGVPTVHHTPRPAPKASPELLTWAKGLNPKRFKSRETRLADLCKGVKGHKNCAEAWCECSCHDVDKNAQLETALRLPWSVCMGVLLVGLGLVF